MDEEQDQGHPTHPSVNRRESTPLSYYTRAAASEARRLSRGFTAANFIVFVKTLVWVVPLTVLIWVYAEREQDSVPEPNVSVAIGIQESDPKLVVTLVSPSDGNITCTLTGPRSKLDQVEGLLKPTGGTPPIMITLPGSLTVGKPNTIPLLDNIKNDPKFKNNGVSVTDCSPTFLTVDADRLVERDIEVVPPPNLSNVDATFSPATVKIKGPAKVLKALADDKRLIAMADVSSLSQLKTPGHYTGINVSLIPPDPDPNITFSTSTVEGDLTVRSSDVTYTLPGTVAVKIDVPGALINDYKYAYSPELLPNITVVGPPNQIDLIKRGEFVPVADVELSADDLTHKDRNSRTVKATLLHLPPGVAVAPSSDLNVTYTVIER